MDTGDLAGAVLGQYRIDALIGRGGMGEVYRAYDETLGRQVALKVLPAALVGNEDSLARFVQEARSASALNHPHVVSIYQIGRDVPSRSGEPASTAPVNYIAMELVAGDTLRVLIERQRLDLKRSLDYLAQAADALAAAHAAGIVHRDFKPDNVMIAEGGYVKVLDFGLAKPSAKSLLEHADTQRTALGTAPGAILGTVGYMSPEQGEGRKADHRSDIFSFGCVLYEVATGVRAFHGTSSVDTLHRIIHAEPEPVVAHAPAAPAELQRIIRKCLAKDPEARYQSMKDVAIDLRALRRELDSTSSSAPAPPSTAKVPAALRRGTWIWLAVAAVAAIAAGLAWRAWSDRVTTGAPVAPLRIERLTGSGGVTDAVISPDGKYVAYVESFGGDQSLWVRQLAGAQALQLIPPARVGYWGLQFSPDSSSVFYAVKGPSFAGGHLFEIPLLGGTPRVVLTGIDSAISWSPDGQQFVYVRENYPEPGASAVMIGARAGGMPRPLAVKRPPLFVAPGFFVAPAWSPDGQRIAASVRNSSTRDAGLITIDVATGEEYVFPSRFRAAGFTSWLPDGSGIVFIAPTPEGAVAQGGGQVYVQPFPNGEPRRLTSDLVAYRNATLSLDGRALVAVGADTAPTLWQLTLDRSAEPRRVPSVRYDGLFGVAAMPDGRILFTTLVGNAMQIAVMNADGSNRRVLTSEGFSLWPQATHDGRTIVFVARRQDQLGIWRMDGDGGNARLLTPVADATYLTMSPDDRTIFFTSAANGPSATWCVSIDGGAPALVTSLIDRAAVSPDGRLLAGLSRSEGGLAVRVLRIDDGKPVQTFSGMPLTAQGGVMHWSVDGSGIIFTTAERNNLWLQRLSGGTPERLTTFSEQTIFRVALSTDGRTVLASRGSQVGDAFLITNFR